MIQADQAGETPIIVASWVGAVTTIRACGTSTTVYSIDSLALLLLSRMESGWTELTGGRSEAVVTIRTQITVRI